MSLEVDGVFKAGVWATTVWADGVWFEGEQPPQPEPEIVSTRGRSGRRYRIIEDPDKILEEVREEEKAVSLERKRLVILQKKAASPSVVGVIYQQFQARIEKLEAKIDNRLERIAELSLRIQVAISEQEEDDEEVLLLS